MGLTTTFAIPHDSFCMLRIDTLSLQHMVYINILLKRGYLIWYEPLTPLQLIAISFDTGYTCRFNSVLFGIIMSEPVTTLLFNLSGLYMGVSVNIRMSVYYYMIYIVLFWHSL